MKTSLLIAAFLWAVSSAGAAHFTPRVEEETYGVGTIGWRFASGLSRDASGRIELCYAEEGSPERTLGVVDVRPFSSSKAGMPELRILFAKAEVEGERQIVLLVGYGIRSGVFVVDVPGLASHSLVVSGIPIASSGGEFTLLGFSDGRAVTFNPEGTMTNIRGRLFFRYIEKT